MGLLIKIRKSEYEAKLAQAETVLNRLESIRDTYATLLSELDSDVLTGEDSNFSMAEELVKQNIDAAKIAIKEAEKARSSLRESVRLYEEHEQAGQQMFKAGIEAAKDVIKAASDMTTVL